MTKYRIVNGPWDPPYQLEREGSEGWEPTTKFFPTVEAADAWISRFLEGIKVVREFEKP